MTLQEAKKQIRDKWMREVKGKMWLPSSSDLEKVNDEAAELYARNKWDEAIQAYEKLNDLDVFYYDKPEFKP